VSNLEIDKKIRKGLPPRRDAASLQTMQDIVIPAGTILRNCGDNKFLAMVGVGLITVHGEFTVDLTGANGDTNAVFKRVVAA
jgi:hypothetical protein